MIVLVGKTCSGKSTVADELETAYGIRRIRTYTTRPPRPGETDEYHFVSDEEFEELKADDFFFETTTYEVASGAIWKYGTSKMEFCRNCCVVMNPDGVKKVKKLMPDDYQVVIIYLNVTEGVVWNRIRARGDTASPDEATRRIEADKTDFGKIESYYDYAITTDNLSAKEVARIIWRLTCQGNA